MLAIVTLARLAVDIADVGVEDAVCKLDCDSLLSARELAFDELP